jgi:hypothetical protein
MKIEIEDYEGNTVVELDIYQRPNGFWDEDKPRIEKIAQKFGYGVADYEDEYHVRFQCEDWDETENDDIALASFVKEVIDLVLI